MIPAAHLSPRASPPNETNKTLLKISRVYWNDTDGFTTVTNMTIRTTHLLQGYLPLLFVLLTLIGNAYTPSPEFNEDEIKVRLLNMPLETVAPRYTPIVRSYLRTYFLLNRTKAEDIIGRSLLYFPMYEAKLRERGLPEELKYLSVVESALHPKALSPVGAKGLWQFMPETGKEYGMKVGYYVDERCDPERSTEAAAEYLIRQYERFGDWALALAAYNSGAGRVSRAIKRARSKDFWKILNYLPKETRNYVPAYIAAAYLMEYYDVHEIAPRYPELDAQLTQTISVYSGLKFHTVAEITGLPLDLIEFLNPAYARLELPASERGMSLTLPRRVVPVMQQYLDALRPDRAETPDIQLHPVYITRPEDYREEAYYYHSVYTVQPDESLSKIASYFGVSAQQLMAWNGLRTESITAGTELRLFHPRSVPLSLEELEHMAPRAPYVAPQPPTSVQVRRAKIKPLQNLPTPTPAPIAPETTGQTIQRLDLRPVPRKRFVYYTVEKQETLLDIANRFAGVSVQDLMLLNNYRSNQVLREGEALKVKKK